jgi:alpha-L-fucosidase
LTAPTLSPAPAAQRSLRRTATLSPDQRMGWWRDAKLGLFLHWGLYSVPGGEWNGSPTKGMAEHIRSKASVSAKDYAALAGQFTAGAYDPDGWCELAVDAGLKYVVFTTKHHDGYCMFDSRLTDYKVTQSACGRDVMAELHAAMLRRGLKIGWYYSPRDWNHPDYLQKLPFDPPNPGADLQRYFAYMQGQVTELLERYGPVSVLWFDGSDHPPEVSGADGLVKHIRRLSPETIINDRVGADGYRCDFGVQEGKIPAAGQVRDWETCMSLNYNWGFNKHDHRWAPPAEVIRNVCDVVSKGGNLLLNVGPDGEGRIPQPAQQTLRALGEWLRFNGEAIYGTRRWRLAADPCVRYTRRGSTLYALVLERPSQSILLSDVPAAESVRLVGGTQNLPIRQEAGGIRVTLPGTLAGQDVWSLRLEGVDIN